MARLSAAAARRIAIAAAGLAAPRPADPNLGHVVRAIRAMGVLQIDSVNVLERAHHLTLFSRLGPYDRRLLDRALDRRKVFEYWGRMASFCPIEDFPLYRPRMERRANADWAKWTELRERAPDYLEAVYQEVLARGPLTTSELEDPGERQGPWWGWADGKVALEHLFGAGRITVSHRRNFTRYYDVVERVIPASILSLPPIPDEEAFERLLLLAAAAQGVATAKDLVDYFWLPVKTATPVLRELVARGALEPIEVEGWAKPAFFLPGARRPRSIEIGRLVNPFDPYMWNRDRIERLHGFAYRIEIYVPQPKRVYGYYVLPFLLDDDLAARVDLKADRAARRLRVRGAFLELGRDVDRVTRALAAELRTMADWLDLDDVVVEPNGDLAASLASAVGALRS